MVKMKLDYTLENGILTVRPTGDIDHHATVSLREQTDRLLSEKRPKKLLLDLSKTEFMDSSGLGLILGRYRKAGEISCDFGLLDPTAGVMRILTLAGVEKLISIERTEKS